MCHRGECDTGDGDRIPCASTMKVLDMLQQYTSSLQQHFLDTKKVCKRASEQAAHLVGKGVNTFFTRMRYVYVFHEVEAVLGRFQDAALELLGDYQLALRVPTDLGLHELMFQLQRLVRRTMDVLNAALAFLTAPPHTNDGITASLQRLHETIAPSVEAFTAAKTVDIETESRPLRAILAAIGSASVTVVKLAMSWQTTLGFVALSIGAVCWRALRMEPGSLLPASAVLPRLLMNVCAVFSGSTAVKRGIRILLLSKIMGHLVQNKFTAYLLGKKSKKKESATETHVRWIALVAGATILTRWLAAWGSEVCETIARELSKGFRLSAQQQKCMEKYATGSVFDICARASANEDSTPSNKNNASESKESAKGAGQAKNPSRETQSIAREPIASEPPETDTVVDSAHYSEEAAGTPTGAQVKPESSWVVKFLEYISQPSDVVGAPAETAHKSEEAADAPAEEVDTLAEEAEAPDPPPKDQVKPESSWVVKFLEYISQPSDVVGAPAETAHKSEEAPDAPVDGPMQVQPNSLEARVRAYMMRNEAKAEHQARCVALLAEVEEAQGPEALANLQKVLMLETMRPGQVANLLHNSQHGLIENPNFEGFFSPSDKVMIDEMLKTFSTSTQVSMNAFTQLVADLNTGTAVTHTGTAVTHLACFASNEFHNLPKQRVLSFLQPYRSDANIPVRDQDARGPYGQQLKGGPKNFAENVISTFLKAYESE